MVAKLRIMASSSVLPTAGAATRPVLHSRPPTRAAARRSKQAIAGIADEPPTPYQGPPSKKRKVVGSSKKKSMIVILRVPSTRLSSYDLSSENEPAIQPLSTRKRKRASGVNTTAVSASTEDRRPDPCGVPSAWAGERQSLCETLPWFRLQQGGSYAHGLYGHGYLVDEGCGERSYMDSEIIITRSGGGANEEVEGVSKQTMHHDRNKAPISCFINSMKNNVPIGIVVGANNAPCPTKPLHRYSVLAWFHLTEVWAEKRNGKICIRNRFEKIYLNKKSWWAPAGSVDPPTVRDFETKALRKTCGSCRHESPQVYQNGWICLYEHCNKFWKLRGTEAPSDMDFNPDFLNERTPYPDLDGVPDLLPELPDPVADALISTERNSWKGLICPKCLACTSRAHWDSWRCETDGCNFVLPVKHTLRNYHSLLADHQVEETGRALPLDEWSAPIKAPKSELLGYWRIQTFSIPGLGTVTHFQSNAHINREAGGAHQILEDLQKAELDLRRNVMASSYVKGTRTAHFTHDYGMPYKFIVAQGCSTALESAPAVIKNALGRMTWAGRHHAQGAHFEPYNEVLALGYFEESKIGFHDDGEDDLAGTIATMSIGCDAEMSMRFKTKYHFAHKLKSYDPTVPIYVGFQEYESRLKLKAMYDNGHTEEYEAAEKALLKKVGADKKGSKKKPPVILKMHLKHGDMVVMSGDQLQRMTEHQVTPKGKMRMGLTARFVKPESVPQDQHWKGDFTIPEEFIYDGDINIVAKVQAAKLARENAVENDIGGDGEEV